MRNYLGLAVLGLVLGILAVINISWGPLVLLGLLILVAIILSQRPLPLLIFGLALILAGAYLFIWEALLGPPKIGGRLVGQGLVTEAREGLVLVRGARTNQARGLRLYLYTDMEASPGQEVSFRGQVLDPEPAMNPGALDQALTDRARGVDGRVRVTSLEPLGPPGGIYHIREALRDRARETFDRLLLPEHAEIMKALTLGQSLDWEVTAPYRALGLVHILAISGFHLGLVRSSLSPLLALLPLTYKQNKALGLLILALYVFLIGWPIGALRVWFLLAITDLGTILRREVRPLQALSLVALVFLLARPYLIFNLGFVLSFLSVFAIHSLGAWLIDRGMGKKYLTQSLAISLAVLIITGPLIIIFAGSLPLMALLANIIIIPLYTLIINLGFFILALAPLLEGGLDLFALLLEGLLTLASSLVKLLAPHGLAISLGQPSFPSLALYYGLIYALVTGTYRALTPYLARLISIQALASCLVLVLATWALQPDLAISMIYVGQGDSFLVQAPGYTALIDTGGTHMEGQDPGRKYTLRTLQALGIRRLDEVLISHFDADHYQGLFSLAEGVRIGRLVSSYMPEEAIREEVLALGLDWELDPDFSRDKGDLHIRTIPNPYQGPDENARSHILHISSGDFSTLFTGDLPSEVEARVLDMVPPVTLLKLGHHGSKTSTSQAFLDRAQPSLALVSAGRNNPFGHPHQEVIDRVQAGGTRVYSSQDKGMVTLALKENQVKIRTQLPQKPLGLGLGTYLVLLAYSILAPVLIRYLRKEMDHGNTRPIWQEGP